MSKSFWRPAHVPTLDEVGPQQSLLHVELEAASLGVVKELVGLEGVGVAIAQGIATLGGDCLAATIEKLNASTVVPAEILICIPEIEAPRAARLAGGNVTVVIADVSSSFRIS